MSTTFNLRVLWGTSRSPNSYGYTTCSLFVDGKRVAGCNGGGYDMKGTVFGSWLARRFPNKLRKLDKPYYGLSFHDPNFNPAKAEVPGTGETVEAREAKGESIGLERYQAFYRASSDLPTPQHTVPLLDGACGMSSMEAVLKAIGGEIRYVGESRKDQFYTVTFKDGINEDADQEEAA